jgi:predicted nucleic acid-binding protein
VRLLLDVNTLVPPGFSNHELHEPVARWVKTRSQQDNEFATCAITKLGFVRILVQIPQHGFSVAQAKHLLLGLKSADNFRFVFLRDDVDASQLPSWVKTPKQVTDGHLAQLAKAHGAVLATLDRGIPGALVIPQK